MVARQLGFDAANNIPLLFTTRGRNAQKQRILDSDLHLLPYTPQ